VQLRRLLHLLVALSHEKKGVCRVESLATTDQ
jgi:hypothetical protein